MSGDGISGLPFGKNARRKRFLGTLADGAGSTNAWQTWELPRAASMVLIYLIGGGGGGGGGRTGPTGTLRGGGGGGGGGGMTRYLMPAFVLSRRIYIRVGNGGRGGGPSTPGTPGSTTLVSSSGTSTANADQMFYSELPSAPAGGGGAGVAAGQASGGTAAIATSPQAMAVFAMQMAAPSTQQGKNASATVGQPVGIVGQAAMLGGASGGSTTALDVESAGGAILGIPWPSPGRTLPGGAAGGGNGMQGLRIDEPFLHTPGSGGGSSNTGQGGRGGDSGIGSGGAGGGGGLTGGFGGNGGFGMLEIIWW